MAQQRATDGAPRPFQRWAPAALDPIDPGLEHAIAQTCGGGRPIPDAARRPVERALTVDLRGVRLRDDAVAARLTRSLTARATTCGPDIFVRLARRVLLHQEGRRGPARAALDVAIAGAGSTRRRRPAAAVAVRVGPDRAGRSASDSERRELYVVVEEVWTTTSTSERTPTSPSSSARSCMRWSTTPRRHVLHPLARARRPRFARDLQPRPVPLRAASPRPRARVHRAHSGARAQPCGGPRRTAGSRGPAPVTDRRREGRCGAAARTGRASCRRAAAPRSSAWTPPTGAGAGAEWSGRWTRKPV